MEISTRNQKRHATAVDLTAMVDLGFLLITFFMLATSFSKPKAMPLIKPDQDGEFDIPLSKTATIVIGAKDKVYVYNMPDQLTSMDDFRFDSLSLLPTGLRKYIQLRQTEVEKTSGDADQLFVIIKPLPGAPVKTIVDVLDEMLINGVKRYTIVNADSMLDSMVVEMAGEKW